MNNLRILVADDHEIVRHGLVALLNSRPGWEVCGEAENGRVAVDKVKELKPDVAILDIGMPTLNGLEATNQILRDNPRVKVLILTITDADRAVRAALDAGARAFILKSDAARDLVAAVQALQYDNFFFTARVADMVLSGYLENVHDAKKKESTAPALNPREREVLQLLAEGESSKDVAATLGISCKTAETHRNNIMRKLKIHSVVELVLFAVRNGVIQVPVTTIDGEVAEHVA
jgi:DNA-binding NarL/FixJ family response regulator